MTAADRVRSCLLFYFKSALGIYQGVQHTMDLHWLMVPRDTQDNKDRRKAKDVAERFTVCLHLLTLTVQGWYWTPLPAPCYSPDISVLVLSQQVLAAACTAVERPALHGAEETASAEVPVPFRT